MAMVAAGVRDRREPAHFHHPHIFTAAADNRRQPQYKAVYADTPGKILRAEQDHVAGAEGFAIVTHRFDALLFTIQLFLQRRFFTLRQPRTPATAYLSPAPTSRRPRSPPAPLR